MLTGKPRLATWSNIDTTVRLFELNASNVFVQIAANAAASDYKALPYFTLNGSFMGVVRKATLADTSAIIESYDLSGSKIASLNRPTGMSPATSYGMWQSNNKTRADAGNALFVGICDNGTPNIPNNYCVNVTAQGLLAGYGNTFRPPALLWARASYDDTCIFFLDASNAAQLYIGVSYTNNSPSGFSVRITPNFGGRVPVDAQWTPDSRYVVIAFNDGTVDVWAVNFAAQTFTQASSISPGLGPAKAVAMRYDGHVFCIGFDNATTKTTQSYMRQGTTLVPIAQYTGIGSMLYFSADGQYVVDPFNKKALKYSTAGTFTNMDSMMVNMPSGVTTAAISYHVDQVYTSSTVYDAAMLAISACGLDLNNIKVALLGTGAVFQHGDTSAAAILAGNEVYGNGWPQTGIKLTGVNVTNTVASRILYTAFDINQIIFPNALQFQKALLYDTTHDTPVAMIDYNALQNVDGASTLTFNASAGWLQLAA